MIFSIKFMTNNVFWNGSNFHQQGGARLSVLAAWRRFSFYENLKQWCDVEIESDWMCWVQGMKLFIRLDKLLLIYLWVIRSETMTVISYLGDQSEDSIQATWSHSANQRPTLPGSHTSFIFPDHWPGSWILSGKLLNVALNLVVYCKVETLIKSFCEHFGYMIDMLEHNFDKVNKVKLILISVLRAWV